mmetsp:Transcript_11671/g.30713  ORF Transcript_11671/g.30713 Transcript_11671/m.30713 type:complete len:230 (-) Transcript_11671:271-960(-)
MSSATRADCPVGHRLHDHLLCRHTTKSEGEVLRLSAGTITVLLLFGRKTPQKRRLQSWVAHSFWVGIDAPGWPTACRQAEVQMHAVLVAVVRCDAVYRLVVHQNRLARSCPYSLHPGHGIEVVSRDLRVPERVAIQALEFVRKLHVCPGRHEQVASIVAITCGAIQHNAKRSRKVVCLAAWDLPLQRLIDMPHIRAVHVRQLVVALKAGLLDRNLDLVVVRIWGLVGER